MSTRVAQEKRTILQKKQHTNFGSGIPYYDDELKMPQSKEHEIAINYLSYAFKFIAKDLRLGSISDHPVWYLMPKPKKEIKQKVIYPDLCVSRNTDTSQVTSEDLLLCLEVVSTERKRKELKDRIIMKDLNEYNRVPEFVLIYPRASDNRIIEYYTFDGYGYTLLEKQGGEYQSTVLEGLSIREIPRDDWKNGEKVEVLYKGEILVRYDELWDVVNQERLEKEKQKQTANQERLEKEKQKQIANQERLEKEKHKQVAEKLAEKLKELGINPNEI
ncbi:MAG: hypothetical protein KDK90_17785 [Leptospiraceae bacterium]|nr:hypothetical protein [Leptospiraceae bacterium]